MLHAHALHASRNTDLRRLTLVCEKPLNADFLNVTATKYVRLTCAESNANEERTTDFAH